MAEGHETPGGEPGRGIQPGGVGPEGPTDLRSSGRAEGDLLAERRARRAAESGEAVLTRRAEAAEATVQTLERHVASLQQRLREAEDERRRMAELLELEKTSAVEREHELRRVKQREYAEQQLRVEAEDRLIGSDRESRAESERLGRRLSASEGEARELAGRLESLQRQLSEAEQGAAAERAAVRRAELDLQARLDVLERRASELQQGLDAGRLARERSERLLQGMRHGHRQMEGLIGELKAMVERLIAAVAAGSQPGDRAGLRARPKPQPREGLEGVETPHGEPEPSARGVGGEDRGAEMSDALAAAVERLRARAEIAPAADRPPPDGELERTPHKHSMSLITRWRIRRKQRRNR